jgi:hypothetical protein
MRNLIELNITEGGRVVRRRPPNRLDYAAFRREFGIQIPDPLRQLLACANGGHAERDTWVNSDARIGSTEIFVINRFLHLGPDRDAFDSMFRLTRIWRKCIGQNFMPFAIDASGGVFVVHALGKSFPVKICGPDYNMKKVRIASSFDRFINGLNTYPVGDQV